MEWENVVAGQRADPEQINKIGNQVSAYKGLRLARRIVLTEAVASIAFDTDDDGNPLDSKLGGELLFWSGENANVTTTYLCTLRLNGINAGGYWGAGSTTSAYLAIGYISAVHSYCAASIRILNGNLLVGSQYVYRYATNGGQGVIGGGMNDPQTAITSVNLYSAAITFPVGTVLEWWERG